MAESDEWATVETVEDDVFYENQRKPTSPVDTSTDYLNDLFTIVSSNAWFIVLVGVALYFLWQKFKGANSSRSSGPQLSPDEVYARQEAMESIRRKMQEQYDLKAQEFAVKQKEKEEKLRQEKLKNLEKYGTVLGKSSKTIAAETNTDENAAAIKRKTEKAKFKPEYNPLMGTASGSGAYFRPARRSGPAGGG